MQGCQDFEMIRVCGEGDDTWDQDGALWSMDLGGDDVYRARVGGTLLKRLVFHIDISGNDRYLAPELTAGAAVDGGVGILVDAAGDDWYTSVARAQGYGDSLSAGMLIDLAGDDVLIGDVGVQGALVAHVGTVTSGFGLLENRGGNDTYRCTLYCQGYIECCGGLAATFTDIDGDDVYECTYGARCRGGDQYYTGFFLDIDGEDAYLSGPGGDNTLWNFGADVGVSRGRLGVI